MALEGTEVIIVTARPAPGGLDVYCGLPCG
jgi:hypothetical protein